jgi:hypothetical protein
LYDFSLHVGKVGNKCREGNENPKAKAVKRQQPTLVCIVEHLDIVAALQELLRSRKEHTRSGQ